MIDHNRKVEWLLECLVHTIGRAALKTEDASKVVGANAKQVRAFNMCDGSLTLSEVAKKARFDLGHLSRTVDRWVENGVMFDLVEGRERRPLHIYSIPQPTRAKSTRRKRKKTR